MYVCYCATTVYYYNLHSNEGVYDRGKQSPTVSIEHVYRLEKLLSEVTEILLFSRTTMTDSPRAPALPPTLILSWRNFSSEAMSMILSSTGLAQSITNVAPFFFPLVPTAAAPRLIFAVTLRSKDPRDREGSLAVKWLIILKSSKTAGCLPT